MVTLNKYTNTKHAKKVAQIAIGCNSKCSLCEDSFSTDQELKKHIGKHLDEIEGLDIASLTHGTDMEFVTDARILSV